MRKLVASNRLEFSIPLVIRGVLYARLRKTRKLSLKHQKSQEPDYLSTWIEMNLQYEL